MSLLSKIGEGTKSLARNVTNKIVNNSRKYATGLALAGALALSPTQKAEAQQYGFTTWNTQLNGGITNHVQSGDLISLYLVQGTASNVYSDLINFKIGTDNALTNNLQLVGSSYFNTSSGAVTNGFYNGKTLDTDPLVTYSPTNMGSYFEGRLSIGSGAPVYASGTGDLIQLQFQAFNNGPTNILVPLQLTGITVGQSGGNWANPLTWSTRNINYGDSIRAYVDVAPVIPEPSTGTLVGAGLLGMLALQRLRRKK